MADLASALLGDLRRRKFHEQLALDAAQGAPTPSWGAALAKALQGGMAGLLERADNESAGREFDATYGGGVGQAPSQPTNPPQPNQLISALEPRGIRNNNPGNIEDGPFARRMPGYAGSDGRFAKFASAENGQTAMDSLLASYGSRGINTVGGVINRWAPPSDNNPTSSYAATVAKGMGIDPNAQIDLSDPAVRQKLSAGIGQFENGRPVQMAQAPSNPASVPAMGTTRVAPQIPPDVYQRARMLAIQGNQAAATAMMQPYLTPKDQDVPLTDPAERARAGISPDDKNAYQRNTGTGKISPVNAQPFAVNISNQAESKFSEEAAKHQAKRFNDLADEAPAAKQMQSDVSMLRDLGEKISTGKIAQAKAIIGPYADALGVKIDGLNEIQAFEAIVNRVAPQMRVKGTGAQSDFELRNFLKQFPSLGNTPEGNAIIDKTLQGFIQNKLTAAEIGSDALNGIITRKDAEKKLRELPDPMAEWREFNKKMPAQQGTQTAPSIDDLVKKHTR